VLEVLCDDDREPHALKVMLSKDCWKREARVHRKLKGVAGVLSLLTKFPFPVTLHGADRILYCILLSRVGKPLGVDLPLGRLRAFEEFSVAVLTRVHALNIVHGDVKPASFIRMADTFYLIDFSSSVDVGSDDFFGETPLFSAPVNDDEPLCASTDFQSLALTWLFLRQHGKVTWEASYASKKAMLAKLKQDDIVFECCMRICDLVNV